MASQHPRARTWTLGQLDTSRQYALWFNDEAQRWDLLDTTTMLPVDLPKPPRRSRRGAQGSASDAVARKPGAPPPTR